MFAEDEADLLFEAATGDELERLIELRASGVPLEHVVGWAEFCGLRIAVEPGVFVPRMRTELLAREAISCTQAHMVVVDLCCGSGAVGRAIAAAESTIQLVAADVDPVAVRCARRNLAGFGEVHAGDLFDALPRQLRGRVELLTANTPYVPSSDIELLPAEARDHEPLATLDGGGDGLDLQRRIARGVRDWLAPGGQLIVEVGAHQVDAAVGIMHTAALMTRVVTDDELEATIVIGTAGSPARAR